MKISLITIFPEIFENFLNTSLIQKSQEKQILSFELINLRDFSTNEHQQIDDQIYWWGAWMLLMAEPIIDAVEYCIQNNKSSLDFSILFPTPAKEAFTQKVAHGLSKKDHLIFICWRYEGIDYRVEEYLQEKYPQAFRKFSLGSFVVLGGEVPSMLMIEAITRLIPWVIKESQSWIEESYALKNNMKILEAPQYTRPKVVKNLSVPEVLLSGDQDAIQKWKERHQKSL